MSTEVFGFDCVPSFSSGESSADGQGFSHRSRAARRRETLTGFLARLHRSQKNEGEAMRLGRDAPLWDLFLQCSTVVGSYPFRVHTDSPCFHPHLIHNPAQAIAVL